MPAPLALALGLLGAGAAHAWLAPDPSPAHAQDPALVRQGADLYRTSCVTCHGANLEGVPGRGPSLVGVGEAAVFFQVSTGRMPLTSQGPEAYRTPPQFSPEEIDALGAFVWATGGGPRRPDQRGAALRGDDPARGGELFRLNCASCHNFTGRGGALSSGKSAPSLDPATEEQIYTAMLTGPDTMPKFSDRQLSPDEKRNIIAYVRSVAEGRNNPGGNPLGGYGPGPEGVVVWIFGMAAMVATAVWIGSRA
ncbi:ubiquinol-cytochrome c reductase cytochrome c subunit [Streptoalloteichus tenebrarius]|uniref:Cytochrome bc1 complex cytochrome c subunit n=1 Tax=Streptoalloteichus tenebrarius (strain ATCC 17920 / DSM 40477 / JCM 4838 / CBS 697.72 / NBRC 16177 / NCIMB 11028 / NRRL B-12390 / A12253. 1 / ISP 5477) TaxID=1933 RepID=A0ABT1HSJ4_STRSD|nr:ubiquinol-cytochrome c reductase cytochrome c subunit [Streptoalloteichus tenebrarius]BFF03563.1 c-type cytochrome [Streptoalloteichus tenebrarius]